MNKKLIETSLPLEAINAASAREKSIRHGHPSTLHLYWARRPLATARAILFAQLVDDPASRPEEFPTVEAQDAERARLHDLMSRLVVWENSSDAALFEQARAEIRRSNGGAIPAVVDPFAGGGSIPLEAQRLGCRAEASDLNPLAVLINKALIDIPPRFRGRPPVHPGAADQPGYRGAEGLAEDVRFYGRWMRDEAERRIGHLYPKVRAPGGTEHTVIAWVWARTVTSPNPANPIEVPLVRSWWLSKKKGKEAWVRATVRDGRVHYEVVNDANGPKGSEDGTMRRGNAVALGDGTPIDIKYIRSEAKAGRLGSQLMAVVAEDKRRRLYLSPTGEQISSAQAERPEDVPNQLIPTRNHDVDRLPMYGMPTWADAFTNRQLVALTTFSDLVGEARQRVLEDALAAGLEEGESLEAGGDGARAYADAIATCLALALSRSTDYCNSLTSWNSSRDGLRNLFSRQAIPMVWDFAEANPFSSSSGNFFGQVEWIAEVIERLPADSAGNARQLSADARDYTGLVVSTDPPYYDNIGYSDLSDFFYVWLRRCLQNIHPSVVSTMLTPKAEELVANPYRHDGKENAAKFFVDGFNTVFHRIRQGANTEVPMTVYYAYKQQEAGREGTSSTGWHTLLDGLIGAGWEVTATWPVRSERGGRMLSVGTNALASSIVLACRPRPGDAPTTTQRAFVQRMKCELPGALRTLMQGDIAPVDLAQAAIGPGIAVFSRYAHVRSASGGDIGAREALELINRTLDEVLGEQESDFDPDTRFAVRWYRQYGWRPEQSGIADQLARTTQTSIAELQRGGIFTTEGGKGRLLSIRELDAQWDPASDSRLSIWEATLRLAALLESKGIEKVAELVAKLPDTIPLSAIKELGFLLFHEAERKGDGADAQALNALVTSWGDVSLKARQYPPTPAGTQSELDI
ncbi:DUF1156 domain-containing protein [Schaalia meyeri]|uniref:DUF1156 domain-containing protein n=1 Tax=Schaalia meyeri TaxID=52773 RepID=UPI0020448FAE|nr:DUF1156 domain-containing protein [Schaalia meyeri]MCM3899685.1 DUF1156 domain-containing protein [Schaalia meyeri]